MNYDALPSKRFSRYIRGNSNLDKERKENILGFGIFYGDGSSFFGITIEDWRLAHKENVQLLLLYLDKFNQTNQPYREAICSWDYYAFDGKEFTAANDTRVLCSKDILYGWWMDKEEWRRIVTYAMETYTNPWR